MENAAFNIAIVLVSSGAVFVAVYFIVKEFFANESRKRMADLKSSANSLVIPAKMQAYERVVLLLERIAPQSLIMRVHKNGMSARMFQAELVKNIRTEYEHNISQQIYLSAGAWELVKTAKEETIKLINIAATRVPDTANSLDLSQKIFEISTQLSQLPTDVAIEKVKKEFSATF